MRCSFIPVCIWLVVLMVSIVEAGEPIKVASIFAKTGKVAFENQSSLEGVRCAVEEVNRRGGVLGRKLELLEFDNHGTALGSKKAAQQAVDAGVTVVFGASWSSHSLAIAPVLQEAKILMISPYSTNPQVTHIGDYIFRICYTDTFQGQLLAKFAHNNLGAKTAGVLINADSQYSEGLARFFMDTFIPLGGEIVFVENYLEKSSDYRAFVEKAKAFEPDVIFHPGHNQASAYVLKQARLGNVNATFLGGDGWNDVMYDLAGDSISGSYYSNHWHSKNPSAVSQEFVDRYKSWPGTLDPGHALSEDAVMIFVDAVKRAGSATPSQIRDALAATRNYQGVTGTISFNDNGDPIKSAVIMKFGERASEYVMTVEP